MLTDSLDNDANFFHTCSLESGISVIAAAIPGIWPLISRRKKSRAPSGHLSPNTLGQLPQGSDYVFRGGPYSKENAPHMGVRNFPQPTEWKEIGLREKLGMEGGLKGSRLSAHNAKAWADCGMDSSDLALLGRTEMGIGRRADVEVGI